jgi:tripartite-type tricarboxylate transporter receptor subunit TctC
MLRLISVVSGWCLCIAAAAQGFPARPIAIVMTSPPGASADNLMRVFAQRVSASIGQPVRIENKTGATDINAAMAVKQAAPDGYTLLQGHIGSMAINPGLFAKLPYDPPRDFEPITLLWKFPSFLVVPTASGTSSVAALASLAKSKPGGLSFASPGIGTSAHLFGQMLATSIGASMAHVPYKGAPPAIIDLVAGRVDFLFISYSSVAPFIKEGKLRALAVGSQSRMAKFPDIPTLAESGFPNVGFETWFGLLAPAGTPQPVIAKLHEEFANAGRSPDVVKRLADEGVDAVTASPAAFAELIAKDTARLRQVIRESGARID